MSIEERKHIENGIWLCYTHGKLIDTDSERFPISTLKKWKQIAELKARILNGGGTIRGHYDEFFELGLAEHNIVFSNYSTQEIGETIAFSCVSSVWRFDLEEYIRDFAIEYARNAFEHGKASKFKILITENKISLIDNGDYFNIWALLSHEKGRGGACSFRELVNKMNFGVVVISKWEDNKNIVLITKVGNPEKVAELTPCSVTLLFDEIELNEISIEVAEDCNAKYVLMPSYITPSVGFTAVDILKTDKTKKPPIFIVKYASTTCRNILKEAFPDSIIVCT